MKKKIDSSLTYNDWVNIVSQYYDDKSYVEETESLKILRLAKQKSENRNKRIDQILNDKA